MKTLIIIGGGGQSRVILDSVDRHAYKEIYIADPNLNVNEIYGIKAIPDVEELFGDDVEVIVGIGDNFIRSKVVRELEKRLVEVNFATVVHPTAYISNTASVGRGTVICAGSHIGPYSQIGDHVIVNTHSIVDHDCKLNTGCSTGPNSTLAGKVEVGEYSIIAISATVSNGVKIGKHVLVAACSCVLSDIKTDCTFWSGVPAVEKRRRQPGEKYL